MKPNFAIVLKNPRELKNFEVKMTYLRRVVPCEVKKLEEASVEPEVYVQKIKELFRCHTAYYSWSFKSHSIGYINESLGEFQAKTVSSVEESCALGKVFNNCLINPDMWEKYHSVEAMLIHITKNRKHDVANYVNEHILD